MMTGKEDPWAAFPPPPRSLVFQIGGVQFVLRPGGLVLFGAIAAALDITFLPVALPGQPPAAYHLTAVTMTLLMIVTTLLHESGHALAYRLQGIRRVRITLRASGGACAAYVERDSPGAGLVRALAGPAVTALVVASLIYVWRVLPAPAPVRLIAATLAVFGLFDLTFNALPTHPRCDGTFALRSLLWLLFRREPERFAVLYLWRPVVLAAAALALAHAAVATGYRPFGPATPLWLALGALALCAVPLAAMIWRLLGHARATDGYLRQA